MFVVKVLLIALALFAVVKCRPEDKYTTKYDNINYDEVIRSERLLENYVKCLLDKGTCNADGTELKRVLPDALQTDCMKCSDHQKAGSKKIVDFLIENKKDWFKELEGKYDPEGVYLKKYNAGK